MESYYLLQLEFIGRLFLACLCGALIGIERTSRMKEAGIRTHLIVALGSALIMIVSKHAFDDILNPGYIDLDPARIASNIVTGVGFLGAGIIFVRNQTISGLTTAAGIWATAGVGMAIGGGMYVVGIAATILIIIIQLILHRNLRMLKGPATELIHIEMKDTRNGISNLQNQLFENNIETLHFKAEKNSEGFIDIELHLKLPSTYHPTSLLELFEGNSSIRSIEIG